MNQQSYSNDYLKPALFYTLNKEPGDPFWMFSECVKEAALRRMLSWRTEYLRHAFVAWATGDEDTADAFNDRVADLQLAIDTLDRWLRRED
jgi:hypothetical protein